MNKSDLPQIMHKISNTYGYIEQKSEEDKLRLVKAYFEELKNYDCKDILSAIDSLSSKNKYIPSVSEIKIEILEQQKSNEYINANLNSCYWYEIEREWCEKNNKPYYDITKVPDYPLPPFKD